MRIALNVQQKFLGVSQVTSVLTVGLALGGLWGTQVLTARMHDNAVTTAALRNHLEADMMHAALRADVLAALHAARQGRADQRDAVRHDLAEHVDLFRESIAANEAMSLPPVVGQALARVDQPLAQYIEAAQTITRLAFAEPDAALAALPAFGQLQAPRGRHERRQRPDRAGRRRDPGGRRGDRDRGTKPHAGGHRRGPAALGRLL